MTEDQQDEAFLQGKTIEVQMWDGSFEKVHVRHINATQFEEYLTVQAILGKFVMLVTGKPEEWVARVAPMSALTISRVGRELNRNFFHEGLREKVEAMREVSPKAAEEFRTQISSTSEPSSSDSSSARATVLTN